MKAAGSEHIEEECGSRRKEATFFLSGNTNG